MTALLSGLARRHLIELRRYAFDTVFQLTGLFLLFLLIFWGAKGIGGTDIRDGDTLPAIVIGFVVFSLVLFAFFSMAQWMTNEATLGTLEQLALSPFGLVGVLAAEYVASLWVHLVTVIVILLVAQALSGEWLHLDVVTLVPLVALLLAQVLGVGLALGGAAIVFKRVASMLNLLQFGFLAMISLSLDANPWIRYMPVGLANHLIRESTVRGAGLTDIDGSDLVALVVVSAAYLAVGTVVFVRMERVARDRGLIGVH